MWYVFGILISSPGDRRDRETERTWDFTVIFRPGDKHLDRVKIGVVVVAHTLNYRSWIYEIWSKWYYGPWGPGLHAVFYGPENSIVVFYKLWFLLNPCFMCGVANNHPAGWLTFILSANNYITILQYSSLYILCLFIPEELVPGQFHNQQAMFVHTSCTYIQFSHEVYLRRLYRDYCSLGLSI